MDSRSVELILKSSQIVSINSCSREVITESAKINRTSSSTTMYFCFCANPRLISAQMRFTLSASSVPSTLPVVFTNSSNMVRYGSTFDSLRCSRRNFRTCSRSCRVTSSWRATTAKSLRRALRISSLIWGLIIY